MVIRAPGTNCDVEMCRGFSLAGAEVELVHLDALCRRPDQLDRVDLVGFPGGFSYGDDVSSGRIVAMKLRERVWPALRLAAARGCPMIGACNGFQIMVQVGLLPGPADGESWPADAAPGPTLSLSDNASARFTDRWVGVVVEESSPCVWTRGLAADVPEAWREEVLQLPVAHGEGRLIGGPGVVRGLAGRGRVALRYAENFNGSEEAAAGVCDATGRIFGLMPHPERYLDWTRHPCWTRLPEAARAGVTPGLRMFENAVRAAVGEPV